MVQKLNSGSNKPMPDRVRRRGELRRQEILRAASRVFRRRGFAASGMREIASEADLSPGNLYHYFNGKDEILFFCQDRSLDTLLSALTAAGHSRRSSSAKLRAVIRAHVHCLLDDLQGSVAHLEPEALPAELRGTVIEKRDRYEKGVRQMIAAGIRDGEFVACDADLVTRAILGAANWCARWFRPDGARPVGAVADALAAYLVRGLESTPESTGGARDVEPEERDGS
jgi:AcrR family transcriptional regulator